MCSAVEVQGDERGTIQRWKEANADNFLGPVLISCVILLILDVFAKSRHLMRFFGANVSQAKSVMLLIFTHFPCLEQNFSITHTEIVLQ